jgi:hypothetical protein
MATPATHVAKGGPEKKRRRRSKKRKNRDREEEEEAFYSPVGSPVTLPPPLQRLETQPAQQHASQQASQQQQQHQQHQQQQQVQRHSQQQEQHGNQMAATRSTQTRRPTRGKRVSPLRQNNNVDLSADLFAETEASGVAAATVAQAEMQPSAPAAAAEEQEQRRNQVSSAAGDGKAERKRKQRKKQRKTLTAKGKRAAVVGVLAETELAKAAEMTGVAAAQAIREDDNSEPQQQQQQEVQPLGPAVQPSSPAGAAPSPASIDPAATANLGRAWSKADIATLARLAEDRAFLVQTVAGHPADGDLDWELISRHFGRCRGGGYTVLHSWQAFLRSCMHVRLARPCLMDRCQLGAITHGALPPTPTRPSAGTAGEAWRYGSSTTAWCG